jgi:NADH-quinone oxidoreductase subunit F
MPLGTSLKTFVYDIGEGAASGRTVKAVQTGGPSGGCIPHEMFDTPVDYENLAQLGSIMGSGGMVVMDEDNCSSNAPIPSRAGSAFRAGLV